MDDSDEPEDQKNVYSSYIEEIAKICICSVNNESRD